MRCFVPVTATATEEIFRISIGAWLLPGNRSQSAQHREKKDIFFIYYPPLSLLGRECSVRIATASDDRRGVVVVVMMKYGTRG